MSNERHWWMTLVETEIRMAAAMRRKEDDVLPYHYANVEARCTLRDRFGINLDDLGYAASDEAVALLQKYRDKEIETKRTLRSLEEADALLHTFDKQAHTGDTDHKDTP